MSEMTHCANCGAEVPVDKPHKVGECQLAESADLVTWTMLREDARDLLRWLRRNRPLGMPGRTFEGLIDAVSGSADKNAISEDITDRLDHEQRQFDHPTVFGDAAAEIRSLRERLKRLKRAEIERDHWKRVSTQRGQAMDEALGKSTEMLERAMVADQRAQIAEATLARVVSRRTQV